MDSQKLKLMLRPKEVAELTSLSLAKVYTMMANGELPSIRCKRSVRVPLKALEAWIEHNTTGGELAAR